MRPDDTSLPSDTRGQTPSSERPFDTQHQAVADITRQQIDAIYSKQQETTESTSPLERTHTTAHTIDPKQWNTYHSAWQQYYQQYYGRYYASAYEQASKQPQQADVQASSDPFTAGEPVSEAPLSKRQAVTELRAQLREKVQTSAGKARKSKHFVPALAAVSVLMLFLFVQYNSTLIAYAQNYISPGNIAPENIIANPNLSIKVSPEPRLIIPKINVDIGVDYAATPSHDSQMAAMRDGVAYFGIPGANSKPGQLGNVPISGHSSNDFTESGNAKFIFARLEQLRKGDVFYLNYEGTRYTYTITRTAVVLPSEVNALQVGTDKPYATLITCTPLGTAEKRFLAFAEQISPSPTEAGTAPTTSSSSESASMAGKSPTIFERAFGAN